MIMESLRVGTMLGRKNGGDGDRAGDGGKKAQILGGGEQMHYINSV
jgi:hypothetical protein